MRDKTTSRKAPTAEQFKRFAITTGLPLVQRLIAAHKKAEEIRAQRDAYIAPYFARFEFYTDPELTRQPTERITCERDLYLAPQRDVKRFYKGCERLHRRNGFNVEPGICPALKAEYDALEVEHECLEALAKFMACPQIADCYGEHREKALQILTETAAYAQQERRAA